MNSSKNTDPFGRKPNESTTFNGEKIPRSAIDNNAQSTEATSRSRRRLIPLAGAVVALTVGAVGEMLTRDARQSDPCANAPTTIELVSHRSSSIPPTPEQNTNPRPRNQNPEMNSDMNKETPTPEGAHRNPMSPIETPDHPMEKIDMNTTPAGVPGQNGGTPDIAGEGPAGQQPYSNGYLPSESGSSTSNTC